MLVCRYFLASLQVWSARSYMSSRKDCWLDENEICTKIQSNIRIILKFSVFNALCEKFFNPVWCLKIKCVDLLSDLKFKALIVLLCKIKESNSKVSQPISRILLIISVDLPKLSRVSKERQRRLVRPEQLTNNS